MTKGINENVDQNSAKYHILATFSISGVVEVQDIIGALFGQTEGLLNDLDLRELQKSGRIGRIVVNSKSENGVTAGEIIIPSSLDRTETAILAATLETVDRVGPCAATLRLKDIKDLRASKLKQIEERAKELLKDWKQGSTDKEDLTEKLQTELEKAQVVNWNGLPAGPDVDKAEHVIIVEGRNDIQQLFKIGVKNAVAVNGTSIPKAIVDLTKTKDCIAFVDGDRGGEMILNELIQVSNIKSYARAPPNREVEELNPKELVKCLQQRRSVEEYLKERKQQEDRERSEREAKERGRQERGRPEHGERDSRQGRDQGRDQRGGYQRNDRYGPGSREGAPQRSAGQGPRDNREHGPRSERGDRGDRRDHGRPEVVVPKDLAPMVKAVISSNEAVALDDQNKEVKRTTNTKIFGEISNTMNTIVVDGVISQRFLEKAVENNVKRIIAVNALPNLKMPEKGQIEIFFFRDFM